VEEEQEREMAIRRKKKLNQKKKKMKPSFVRLRGRWIGRPAPSAVTVGKGGRWICKRERETVRGGGTLCGEARFVRGGGTVRGGGGTWWAEALDVGGRR
jgi:hypothetical protein